MNNSVRGRKMAVERTFLYNHIPSRIMQGKILELGAGNQLYQLKSIHHEKFITSDYIGIDLDPPEKSPIKIIKQDIKTAILNLCK